MSKLNIFSGWNYWSFTSKLTMIVAIMFVAGFVLIPIAILSLVVNPKLWGPLTLSGVGIMVIAFIVWILIPFCSNKHAAMQIRKNNRDGKKD